MTTLLLIASGVAVSVFALICLFLYLRQDRFLFIPVRNDATLALKFDAQRVQIAAGKHWIEGWWTDHPTASSNAVVLYFGGNTEDVLYTAATAQQIDARRLLVTNYRGYGNTPGRPGQKELFGDALAIYDYATQTAGVAPADIVVMGRSLGSGVATWLASQRQVRATILVTPYDSILSVAERHYSAFPVRALLRHPFPSLDYAAHARAPALIIAAERDTLIPVAHAQRLAAAWGGSHAIEVLPGVAHGDVERHADYYPLINEFLRKL